MAFSLKNAGEKYKTLAHQKIPRHVSLGPWLAPRVLPSCSDMLCVCVCACVCCAVM